ncbi:anti-sigma factor family protein [Phenylobacterium sp.]|uniref:anti-sigma factor family protein n=1 Tax=Phenylobacterium sp. TaxID=1871053 RepID=UPI002CAAC482|nr:zf-HC2 domain-containing protein [Phenylobacterium sp.]HLZ74925.1 zf-HC2 domain-containing protein [Phenylobacterium sp.]
MSACADKAMLLQGLVDGELDAVNAAACEAHLKVCDACNTEYLRLLALRRELAAPGVAYAAPERLRANIEAMLAAETAAETPTRRPIRRGAPWAAGGLGGLLAATLAVMFVVPQVTEAGVERQLVANHVRSLMVGHLTDVATSNQHVVRPWFNGKVDIAPPVPELAAEGFPLVGGRLDYVDGHVAPAIVYKRRLHTVNLFVWPAEGRVLNEARSTRRDGYSLTEWTSGGLRFAAVSDIEPADLQRFKAAFINGSSAPSH